MQPLSKNSWRMIMIKHPGEIFDELVMVPFGLSIKDIASRMALPHEHLLMLLRGGIRLEPYDALKIGYFTNTEPMDWLRLQWKYDQHQLESFPKEVVELAVNKRGYDIHNINLEDYLNDRTKD